MKKVDDKAPNFSLEDSTGRRVSLSDHAGKTAVVLYFYPKNHTPGCTREACSFRDSYEDFKELGAEVIGISSDTGSSHAGFASRYRLPFVLLSDPNGAVRKAYGVSKAFGLLPGRVTFIIDKSGAIRHVFSSQFRAHKHVEEAIRIIRSIHGES